MLPFGVCLLSQVPLRETVSHASEMVSQLLFGETFAVLEKYAHWLKIRTDADGYEAWVDSKQVQLIDKDTHQLWMNDDKAAFILEPYAKLVREGGRLAPLSVGMGARLPLWENGAFKSADGGTFSVGASASVGAGSSMGTNVSAGSSASAGAANADTEILLTAEKRQNMHDAQRRKALLLSAALWLDTPYLWGGKSIFGTDCSGFTQTLYRLYGVQLPRNAADQATTGETVNFLDEAQAGDLLFFDNENEQIVHVGIYMGEEQIIHASGMVRIDTIDNQGIFRQDTKVYTHKLRLIRRVLA